MDDDTKSLIWFIVVIVAIIAILFGFCFWMDSLYCKFKTRTMDFNHRYTVMTGCMVEPQVGKWIPIENWVVTDK
jgi:hypothetical protein